jgi:ATP synthase protein I
MSNDRPREKTAPFANVVGDKATRKLAAQRSKQSTWIGLGMMGLIGWSVVVPTLLGAMIGIYVDKHHPGNRSWTLILLLSGLALGCGNAGYWVVQQDQQIEGENHG